MNICIYGAASADLDQIYYDKTEQLGRLMAKRGHGLVFGGGETGLMGAAARGVAAEKGYILITETMRERKHLLEEKSQATIVAPGGIGTYEEFFEIFTLKSLNRLDRAIVFYNINGYYDLMKKLLEHTVKEKFMAPEIMEMCRFMENPEEILDYIENY